MSPPSWATRGRFLFNTDDLPVLRVLEIHRPISYHIDIDDDGAAIADRPDDPSDEVLISLVRDEIILEDVIEPHDFGHGVQKLYDERPRPYHIVCDYTIRFSVRRVNTLQRLQVTVDLDKDIVLEKKALCPCSAPASSLMTT